MSPERMTYRDIFKNGKKINLSQVVTLSTTYEYLFLWISFFVVPIFVILRVPANMVTFLMLLTGVGAAVCIGYGSAVSMTLGILFYLVAQVLDASDGSVARITNTSTFYGRFLDGVVDMIILWALQLSLACVLYANAHNRFFVWVSIVAVLLTPFHHLYFDRYSAYARWINEELGLNIKPYLKRTLSPKLNWFLNDLQYTCLIAIPVLFSLENISWQYLLFVYYIVHIIRGIYYIAVHTIQASKVMRVEAKQK